MLKIAFITQAIDRDDPILGFTVDWINALSGIVDNVHVICLRKGRAEVNPNITIHIMPEGRLKRFRFVKKVVHDSSIRGDINAVIAHMCPSYAIAGGLSAGRKYRLALWYAHSHKSIVLRTTEKLVDVVFSCSRGSFPMKSDKLIVTGHGIDTEKFRPKGHIRNNNIFRIVSVGRISPVKRYEIALRAVSILKKKHGISDIRYEIFGPVVSHSDKEYANMLTSLAYSLGVGDSFRINDPVTNEQVNEIFNRADIVANMMRGSLDKSALESCSCGTPVITTNNEFREVFQDYSGLLISPSERPDDFASLIESLFKQDEAKKEKMGHFLRQQIISNHSLYGLMQKIKSHFESML